MDRGYELFYEMLATTFNAAELAGVRMQDAFPALVDYVAALGIAMSGEEGAEAVIDRVRRRTPSPGPAPAGSDPPASARRDTACAS
jgi:hypothetical protein